MFSFVFGNNEERIIKSERRRGNWSERDTNQGYWRERDAAFATLFEA